MALLRHLLIFLLSSEEALRDLAWENLALRQQLAVATRSHKRPRLRATDRFFWVLLSRLWKGWRSALVIVKPDTVVAWHRKGFKLCWRWRSRKRTGRPPTDPAIQALIRRMADANPLWGAPHTHGELLKLGIQISERIVSNLMPRRTPKPPSQTWLAFLRNHMSTMASADFFTVLTATFRVLFVFVVLSHERR
jgi:putative transposase